MEGIIEGRDGAMRELGYLVDDAHAGRNLKALALLPAHANRGRDLGGR